MRIMQRSYRRHPTLFSFVTHTHGAWPEGFDHRRFGRRRRNLASCATRVIDEQGFQCAFCMPGFIMTAVGFLKTNPNPTRRELAHGVSGNLCRCQDYDKILTALMRGAQNMRRSSLG